MLSLFRLSVLATTLLLLACSAPPRNTAPASQVPPALAEQLKVIGPVINPPATAKLYAPLAQTEPYEGMSVERDLAYGPAERNRLDVFVPRGAASRPVVVFVHGGGWVAGNKRAPGSPFYDNVMLWAAKSGFVGVNMTYRLAPQNPWPAAQQDIAAALTWVRQNIPARGGDPTRIYLMGHSAGAAHVAQYLAHPQFHVAAGSGLAGAMLVSGVFDLATFEAAPTLQPYFGADRALYAERSALVGMTRSRVPMLLAAAELDPADFRAQMQQARAALCEAGNCPWTIELLGHSHMSEIYSINTEDRVLTDALRQFVEGRR